MVAVFNLITYVAILALFLFSQMQAKAINSENNDVNDLDLDDLRELLLSEEGHLHHQQFRRASLRYQPHILYKKASLKPIYVQNGKLKFSKRDFD